MEQLLVTPVSAALTHSRNSASRNSAQAFGRTQLGGLRLITLLAFGWLIANVPTLMAQGTGAGGASSSGGSAPGGGATAGPGDDGTRHHGAPAVPAPGSDAVH